MAGHPHPIIIVRSTRHYYLLSLHYSLFSKTKVKSEERRLKSEKYYLSSRKYDSPSEAGGWFSFFFLAETATSTMIVTT